MCDNGEFVISGVFICESKHDLNVEIIHAAKCENSNSVKQMIINLSVPQILLF